MATAEASVSTTNSFDKSGSVNTGTVVIVVFNAVKAESASELHVKVVERSKSVRGAARDAY